MQLLCTVRGCRALLAADERRLVCPMGHAFDVARSGYVNLLQPQDKRSKTPGDTEEAVQARRRLFDAGVTDALVTAIVDALPLRKEETLLDVGCGEGHHLEAFRRRYGVHATGTDISIPAVDLAARRYRHCTWVVANADRFLPWPDGTFDALTSITARLQPEEFRRVLRSGGRLLLAIPAADDLVEIREAVMGGRVERDRVERTVDMFAAHFALESRAHVAQSAELGHDALVDIMTSSYRGLRPRERERLATVEKMHVTMARDLLLLRAS